MAMQSADLISSSVLTGAEFSEPNIVLIVSSIPLILSPVRVTGPRVILIRVRMI